jgi:chromosome segregation ATPase
MSTLFRSRTSTGGAHNKGDVTSSSSSLKPNSLSGKKHVSSGTAAINDYSHITSVNEMRTVVLSLEKESLRKNKETRQRAKEVREAKSNLKACHKKYQSRIDSLKAERDAALSESRKAESRKAELLSLREELEMKLSEIQMQYETNASEMEDLEDELDTWKEYSQTAVAAAQADTQATIAKSAADTDSARLRSQSIKEELHRAKRRIASLQQDMKEVEEARIATKGEIRDTKECIAARSVAFEEELLQLKHEAQLTVKSCEVDAGMAQKHLRGIQTERDEAQLRVQELRQRVFVLDSVVVGLESDQSIHDKEHEKNMAHIAKMRDELMSSKEEFENALKSCEEDISNAYSKIRICVAEKESALADADEAMMNLRQVNKALIALKRDMKEERDMYNTPWWRKAICSSRTRGH